MEGALASQSQFIAVMDGDLQHDERLLPQMLHLLRQQQAELVIASRYVPGGDAKGFSLSRQIDKHVGTR